MDCQKALPVTLLTAASLAIIDNVLAINLHLTPLYRLPILAIVFVLSLLLVCRELSVFTADDFELLENAVPGILTPTLEVMERFLVRRNGDPT